MKEARGEVVELIPDAVYRLGGRVRRDGRLSWAPADGAYEPISCYLLREGDRALLIDTGVAVHEEAIGRQLAALLPKGCRLSIFLTRAELDCMGNLGAIAQAFPVEEVFTGGVVNPFDAFDHVQSLVQKTVPFRRGADTSSLTIGPGRDLVVLRPHLRLLATFWVYDQATKTLFTSDAFGHVAVDGPEVPVVSADGMSAGAVRTHLYAKFDWLAGCSRAGEVARGIADTFDRYPTHAIAPGHGCVLQGEACVRDHVDSVLAVLEAPSNVVGGADA